MRRETTAALIAIAVVLVVVFAVALVLVPRLTAKSSVHISDAIVEVDIVTTPAARTRGLSGRSGLAPNAGMLFVFDHDERWPIWMKDMKFSIDIIWMDSNKRVVGVAKNITPDTYPQQFTPPELARYVLELPAGTADTKHIYQGIQASFDLE